MIYCLKGELLKKTTEQAVILCGGVGYQVQLPATVAAALPGAGAQVTLYTYMNITENDVSLFGFSTEERMGKPEELGYALATVADERNGYLAGVDVLCDGGSTNGIQEFKKKK